MALKDPFLPVKRKMIGVFADGHMRQQPWSRQPLLDRLHRLLRREHGAALRAGVFLTGFLDHIQRGRDVFQPLADLFAYVPKVSLTLRTLPFIFSEIKDLPLPGQRLRQTLPAVP